MRAVWSTGPRSAFRLAGSGAAPWLSMKSTSVNALTGAVARIKASNRRAVQGRIELPAGNRNALFYRPNGGVPSGASVIPDDDRVHQERDPGAVAGGENAADQDRCSWPDHRRDRSAHRIHL